MVGAILKKLSRDLRLEVSEFSASHLLGSVDIFRSLNSADNREMWAAILPLLRPIKYEEGDILCEQVSLSLSLTASASASASA